MPAGRPRLSNCDPTHRTRLKLHTARTKRLRVRHKVQEQIPVHLIELAPSRSEPTKSALPPIPSFVIGASDPIPPAIRKPQNAFLCGLVLRINEIIQQECEHEVLACKRDFGCLAVRFGIP